MDEKERSQIAEEIDLDELEEKNSLENKHFIDFVIKGYFYSRDYSNNGIFIADFNGFKGLVNDFSILFKSKLTDDDKNLKKNWKKFKVHLQRQLSDLDEDDQFFVKTYERNETFSKIITDVEIKEWFEILKSIIESGKTIDYIDNDLLKPKIKPFFKNFLAISEPEISLFLDIKVISKESYESQTDIEEEKIAQKRDTNILRVEPKISPDKGKSIQELELNDEVYVKLTSLKDIERFVCNSDNGMTVDKYLENPYIKSYVHSIKKERSKNIENAYKVIVKFSEEFFGVFIESGTLKVKLKDYKFVKTKVETKSPTWVIFLVSAIIILFFIVLKYFLF